MRRMLPQVATAAPWITGTPATAMNVAFTFAGLSALGLAPEVMESFPAAFQDGMAARAEQLGDRGPSAPSEWEDGLGTVKRTCSSRSTRSTGSTCGRPWPR